MTTETKITAAATETPDRVTILTTDEAVTIYRGAHWDGSDWAHHWWSADPSHAAGFGATRSGSLPAGSTVAVVAASVADAPLALALSVALGSLAAWRAHRLTQQVRDDETGTEG